MSFSDYWENLILDTMLEVAGNYVGWSTADPLDNGSGLAEPVGNGYARVSISAASWNAASGGSKTNALAFEFPVATGDQGTAAYLCVFDAATSGNLLASGALTATKVVASGQTFRIPAGSATVTLG